MKSIYILFHKVLLKSENDEDIYDSKIIGYFSSRELAEKTENEYKHLQGFKDYPDNFFIQEYIVNKDYYGA